MSGAKLLLLGAVQQAVASDPYFENTTLLLPGNGTNGAQNNTFLDSSTNAFSITRNGNTTQGTFSPFSQTGWGNYFDGSGDGISFGSNVNTNPASSDITVEAWIYPLAYNSYGPIFSNDVNGGFHFGKIASGFGVRHYGTGDVVFTATTPALNQWTHVAVSRSGNSWYLFYNGTQVATATASNSFTQGTACVGGNASTAAEAWNGYLSNVRFVKGTALYTSNFTPSTTPLTAVSNTQLLTCQSNRFKDNSSNAYAATVFGTPSIQAFSPFNPTASWSAATNGGSGYFDGSGDYLTAPDNAASEIGASDFCVEGWFYPTVSNASYQTVFCKNQVGITNGYGPIYITFISGVMKAYAASGSSSWNVLSNVTIGTPQLNAWNHFVVCRSGANWGLYLNGTRNSTASSTATLLDNSANYGIGAQPAGAEPTTGYLSGIRLVIGSSVYDPTQSTLTVPTAPLTAITNTQLLLSCTNAGIYDATSKNDLETVGNAQISTTQSKFGGSSMYFDGTGDYLFRNGASDLFVISSDYTVECWVYFNSTSGTQILVTYGTLPWYLCIGDITAGKAQFTWSSSAPTNYHAIGTTTLSTGTWYHIAGVRYGSNIYLYVNGVQEAVTAISGSPRSPSTNALAIGANAAGSSTANVYIQDVRITKGIARYTSNFTVPTSAFPLL